jgi:hypothetical protein
MIWSPTAEPCERRVGGHQLRPCDERIKKMIMTWTTPILIEICIGLEIKGHLPAEF